MDMQQKSCIPDDGTDAAPAPKEVIIIGSFGNHEQWKLPLVNNFALFY